MPKSHRLRLMFAILVPFFSGCVSNGPRSYQEAASQDYGEEVAQTVAEDSAHAVMNGLLKDPTSAIWQCRPPERGWIGSGMIGGQTLYGWILVCAVNAKNSYGAYAGAQEYHFLFRGPTLYRAAIFEGSGILATQQVVYNR